ncbi:hypothetical protein KCTC52924_03407 [Arenibacter antarcticus]|uniref:Uncharacterized protein n=1 Tax=Arenibacter antarcticus TaxID=2040469 RepID=A0ABW5VEQ4_9FLAO|nr:hypothetical protein [Arenibacter sp. H213]MCM4166475.1 hypothetical protein [Arenibacter sp. H213]
MNQKSYFGALITAIFTLTILWSCGSNGKKASGEIAADNASGGIQIGVALYSFNRFPFHETLDKSKGAGAEIVEGFFFHKLGEDFENKTMQNLNDEELQKMKRIIDEKGLRMPSIYADAKTQEEWIKFFEIGRILDIDFLVGEPEPKFLNLLDSLGERAE